MISTKSYTKVIYNTLLGKSKGRDIYYIYIIYITILYIILNISKLRKNPVYILYNFV